MTETTAETTATFAAGYVDWDDTSFEPEQTYSGDYEPVRQVRMSKSWPQRPFEDRKFQLGGKERVAFLEEGTFMAYVHRFNKQHMGSGINGTRRCSLETLGHCLACDHWEQAPLVDEGGRKTRRSRCGRRQQQFAINVLVYKTDLDGNLLGPQPAGTPIGMNAGRLITLDPEKGPIYQDDGTPAELVYEVMLLRFNADKFVALREAKREWGSLLQQDFTFILDPNKDEKFQDFSINIAPKSAWRALQAANTDAAKAVVEYYKEHRYDLEQLIGKPTSDEDMKVFLGLSSPSAGTSRSTDPDTTAALASEIESELSKIQSGEVAVGGEAIPVPEAPAVAEPTPPLVAETPPEATPETPAQPEAAPPPDSDFDKLLNG